MAAGSCLQLKQSLLGGVPAGMSLPARSASWPQSRQTRIYGWVKLIGDWPRKGVEGPVANFDEEELKDAVAVSQRPPGPGGGPHHGSRGPVPWRCGQESIPIEHGLFLTDETLRFSGLGRVLGADRPPNGGNDQTTR